MPTPSEIACKGMGLAPDESIVSDDDQNCITCGATIPAGEGHAEWKPGGTFTDLQYLAAGGKAVCRYCKPLLAKSAMTKIGAAVIAEDRAWKLTKDSHVTWILRDPPTPPFLALFKSSTQSQHVAWRAAITEDRDLILVQFGLVTMPVDRPLLFAAEEWANTVADWAREQGIRVTPNHPFMSLSRKRDDPHHGVINPRIVAAATGHPEIEDLIERLQGLGEGELWGLSVLAKSKPVEPMEETLA